MRHTQRLSDSGTLRYCNSNGITVRMRSLGWGSPRTTAGTIDTDASRRNTLMDVPITRRLWSRLGKGLLSDLLCCVSLPPSSSEMKGISEGRNPIFHQPGTRVRQTSDGICVVLPFFPFPIPARPHFNEVFSRSASPSNPRSWVDARSSTYLPIRDTTRLG